MCTQLVVNQGEQNSFLFSHFFEGGKSFTRQNKLDVAKKFLHPKNKLRTIIIEWTKGSNSV